MRLPPAAVVIPAAGEGLRLPGRVRKPWRDLAGQPLVLRTLEAFRGLPFVREIVLLVHPEDMAWVKRRWSRALAALRVASIAPGGSTRARSVAIGVAATSPSCRLILVHDAARPLVTPSEIRSVAATAWRHGAAILAMPCSDTVKEVAAIGTKGRIIRKTFSRNRLWLAQTPQAFRRDLLLGALIRPLKGNGPTDDAGLLEGSFPVRVVAGTGGNFKVSSPADLARVRILWNSKA